MKKYISGLITGLIISISITVFAAELNVVPNPYPILVNGTETSANGYNIDGSTYLGLKDTAKALDATVNFNSEDKAIEITSDKVEDEKMNDTPLPDFSVPELDSIIDKDALKPLEEKDVYSVEYNGYEAVIYNKNTFVISEYLKDKDYTCEVSKITSELKINKKSIKSAKIKKDFIIYNERIYFNINFLTSNGYI